MSRLAQAKMAMTCTRSSASRSDSPARSPRRRALTALAALTATGLVPAGIAWARGAAAAWPAQPIKVIVPYPPGGNADAIARLVAQEIAISLGQGVVVENKAGAGGTIGTQQAARSPGDGYTFLMTPSATITLTPHLRKVPYDPLRDLLPVARMSSSYGLMAVRKDLQADNLREFIELAGKQPGGLTFGSVGLGTATHITAEIVHQAAGIRLTHIPYKGSAESLNDLLGGRIDVIYDPVALAQVKAGKLKALAANSPERNPELPEVPTFREQGLDIPGGSWFGVFAPPGTPATVIARMETEVAKAVNAPGARAAMARFNQFPDYQGTRAFAASVRSESEGFGRLVTRLGLTLE